MNDVKFVKLKRLVGIFPPPFPQCYQSIKKRVTEWGETGEVIVYIYKSEKKNGNRYFVDIYSLNRYFKSEFGFEIFSILKKLIN